jgi:ribosomal protein S18 acetylase RimI-like enzyme
MSNVDAMQVTVASPEDCATIARIHVSSWQAAYAALLPAEYLASLSVSEREQSWRGMLEAATSRTLVVKREAEVVGFISFGRCRDEDAPARRGEVWALYVSPHAWSSGAGWALWESARVQMLHAGFAEVSLWVLTGNARGLRFYEAVGFRREVRSEKLFERGGATLEEVRLVFERMSAHPSIERTWTGELRSAAAPAQVRR